MVQKNPAVDAYIANAAAFAQPILRRLRKCVHQACPAVEEKIKWGMPFFDHHGMMCNMAAFKQHCAFGFWKYKLLAAEGLTPADDSAMGQFGRIASMSDLPDDAVLQRLIRRAVELNDGGIKAAPKPKSPRKPPPLVPPELIAALKNNKAARETFDNFSPSHRRDYAEWIAEAKTEATRARRLATTLEWLAEGKTRHWKYQRK
jgi:uncharacterized protein YdeI (YjbR/CyaY-like superfamily)